MEKGLNKKIKEDNFEKIKIMEKFWRIKNTRNGFKGDWIDLNVDNVELPDGKVLHYEALHYHRDGVGVVAENDAGEIILIKSYRYINDYYGWECPAGTVPPEQHHSECVIQELKEEAGCEFEKEKLIYMGNFYPSIGSSDQLFHCYYAKGVRQTGDFPDKNEVLETKWVEKKEIRKMISKGEIKDGFSIALLLMALK